MPSSNLVSILGVFKAIADINPKSILDTGAGFGKWGFLIREYFDLRPGKGGGYDKWSMTIDGIEVHEKYLTPVHKYIYDDIFTGDALEILENGNFHYDLILALDIIEHFNKKDGLKFLDLCRNRADNVIVNTPNIYMEQADLWDNEYEIHRSGWDIEDFKSAGAPYIWTTGINLTAVFSEKDLDLPRAEHIYIENPEGLDLIIIKKLVKLYMDTGQFEECIGICEKYIAFFKDDYELHSAAAASYEKIGDIDQALSYANKTLSINSSSSIAKKILHRSGK